MSVRANSRADYRMQFHNREVRACVCENVTVTVGRIKALGFSSMLQIGDSFDRIFWNINKVMREAVRSTWAT